MIDGNGGKDRAHRFCGMDGNGGIAGIGGLLIGYALAYTLGLRARLWQDATDQDDGRR